MLEYIFFNRKTYDLFKKSAISSGINAETDCNEECFTVRLPEEMDEDVIEKLEDYYDELMDLDQMLTEQALSEQTDSSDTLHVAGITIQLKDGRNVYASIDPELLNRVLKNISPDELNILVSAITEAVENPDERSFCQRQENE